MLLLPSVLFVSPKPCQRKQQWVSQSRETLTFHRSLLHVSCEFSISLLCRLLILGLWRVTHDMWLGFVTWHPAPAQWPTPIRRSTSLWATTRFWMRATTISTTSTTSSAALVNLQRHTCPAQASTQNIKLIFWGPCKHMESQSGWQFVPLKGHPWKLVLHCAWCFTLKQMQNY